MTEVGVDRARHFDPETGELILDVRLPPSANRLSRSSKFGVHPTPEYAAWLTTYSPYLRETLGDAWEPDRERWWAVWIDLHLGTAGGDGDNRTKALLDLLAGAYVTEKGECGADGLPVSAGLVRRRGGLFNDDCRLRKVAVRVLRVNSTDPHLRVYAQPTEAPTDEREERRAAKEEEREKARQARQEAKDAASREKAAGRAKKAEEKRKLAEAKKAELAANHLPIPARARKGVG